MALFGLANCSPTTVVKTHIETFQIPPALFACDDPASAAAMIAAVKQQGDVVPVLATMAKGWKGCYGNLQTLHQIIDEQAAAAAKLP